MKKPEKSSVIRFPRKRVVKQEAPEDLRTPENSDGDLALRFAKRHSKELRFVEEWGKWYFWKGDRWRVSNSAVAFSRARSICREVAFKTNTKALASASTVAAVERLAKVDARLASSSEDWDADPWLLNTPGGVVDLKTGEVLPHDPRDFMTKITAVGPNARPTPLWDKFLDRVTDGDKDLQGFLQRAFGYCLTGSTREHALFFLHGPGGNGKNAAVGTVSGIMGSYAKASPMSTFTEAPFERHPTELADLYGARMVTASETERGKRWAEARIKMLTGGDPVSARFMRQDFFQFVPQFKLVILGNFRPALTSVDEAIRRRFHLIPFNVIIPAKERDTRLPEKLRDEWPGILDWMIEGCLDRQENGLQPPRIVQEATNEYLKAEDRYASWIEEFAMIMPDAWESRKDLFYSWRTWAGQEQ